jgi:hypothetical protein
MAALENGNMDPTQRLCELRGQLLDSPLYINVTGVTWKCKLLFRSGPYPANTYFPGNGPAGRQRWTGGCGPAVWAWGQKTGIDLPHEAKGLVPTRPGKKEINALLIDQNMTGSAKN